MRMFITVLCTNIYYTTLVQFKVAVYKKKITNKTFQK
jgi:hypothetical protein